ncbi:MAG: hypothetical protein COX79_02745 [Candidatus Levybacteria bacterium CG_4_10_14_0_2_um_filter_36_16]|nr:MAG: hypothetical protein AUK12_05060 [Candidatus Levybacteria bacterium CG2_30_37_29]PIZ97311.1 MAG: hypothetical protein COX79_02745 [Candidatus Levybacteria bacterium CG_4_10_14_0_2_um_filter_36_16]
MKIECGVRHSQAEITDDGVMPERLIYKNFGEDVSIGQVFSTAEVVIDCSKCPFSETLKATVIGISPAFQAIKAVESEAEQKVETIKKDCML